MRVVGGTWSGRTLHVPRIDGFRPTGDRVREALFSILGHAVESGTFLELFAGSGAVGIEARSRGAPRIVLVERDRKAVETIERNLEEIDVRSAEVIASDAIAALRALGRRPGGFATIFADPPYDYPRRSRLLRAVAESGSLAPGGVFVLEHATRATLPADPPGLRRRRTALYGDASLSFFEAGADGPATAPAGSADR